MQCVHKDICQGVNSISTFSSVRDVKQKSTAAGVITAKLLYIRKPKTSVQYSLCAMIVILCRRTIRHYRLIVANQRRRWWDAAPVPHW